jgi:methyl-accepting chemotaxis protein/methyl-accepting chemotaxis protein-1 (serine sensor receptor)
MNIHLTISRKFAVAGAVLMALCVTLGMVALFAQTGLQTAVEQLSRNAMPGLSHSGKMAAALNEMRGDVLKHIGASDPKTMDAAEVNIRKLKQTIADTLKAYQDRAADPQERQLAASIGPAVERYYDVCDRVLAVSRAGRSVEAYKKYEDESINTGIFRAAKASVQALADFNQKEGDRDSSDSAVAAQRARWLIWSILGASVISGVGLLYGIIRSINRALRRTTLELARGAEQVAQAAAQVSSSSQSMAQGASEQASSLEQISASTEEISSMARRNTDNAGASAELAAQSQAKFTAADSSLEEMVQVMGEINAAGGKISRIMKVIDDIAFQTNLLALNAAVEAARAGEAGLGFAVVAEEVRNLSQRCAQAAKDTAVLIEESIASAGRGQQKVTEVAGAIRAITGDSTRVKELASEVNLGSQEQSRGLSEIGKAIVQMEQITQTTAASAEQGAAAAEQLLAQSQSLEAIVARLNVMISSEAAR